MPLDPVHRAVALHDRAEELLRGGRHRQAETAVLRSLRVLEKVEGRGHPDVANVLNTLGRIHEQRCAYGRAERCYRRSVRIMRRFRGDGDIARIRVQSLCLFADLLRAMGRYGRAEPLLREALALAERALGRRDSEVASVCNSLGMLYKYAGRFAEAGRSYRRALSITGPDADLYHNLGGLEHARGRHARGEPFARKSVELRRRSRGRNHPAVAADEAALAALLEGQGKLDEAESIYRRVLRLFERIHGPTHYEIAVNLNNLAAIRFKRGDGKGAENLYRRALAIKERILGKRHPDVAITLNNLAVLCESQGRTAEAKPLYRGALAIFKKALGPRHPHTRACGKSLKAPAPRRVATSDSPRPQD